MKRIVLLFLFIATTVVLSAHPHVFMDMNSDIIFNKKGLEGFYVHWRFDEMFSSGVRLSYDSNGNGSFENSEIELLKSEYFNNLANFNYFISYELNGKSRKVTKVSDFTAILEDNVVSYKFFVPLRADFSSRKQTLQIFPMDYSFYCSLVFNKKNGLRLDKGSSSADIKGSLSLIKKFKYDDSNLPPFLDPVSGKEYGVPVFFDPSTKKEVKPREAIITFKK